MDIMVIMNMKACDNFAGVAAAESPRPGRTTPRRNRGSRCARPLDGQIRVERDPKRLSSRHVHPPVVRRAGGCQAGGDRIGLRARASSYGGPQ